MFVLKACDNKSYCSQYKKLFKLIIKLIFHNSYVLKPLSNYIISHLQVHFLKYICILLTNSFYNFIGLLLEGNCLWLSVGGVSPLVAKLIVESRLHLLGCHNKSVKRLLTFDVLIKISLSYFELVELLLAKLVLGHVWELE